MKVPKSFTVKVVITLFLFALGQSLAAKKVKPTIRKDNAVPPFPTEQV